MQDAVKHKIEALRRAHWLIKNGHSSFVCLALEKFAGEPGTNLDKMAAAHSLIFEIRDVFKRAGLSGDSTVLEWLCHVTGQEIYTGLRQYRLRWIESWIAELEAGTKT